jgi:hypothetical protein
VSFLVGLVDRRLRGEIIWTELMIVKLEVHSVLNHCTGTWDTSLQFVSYEFTSY